jgi:Retrotransposon gag protein/Zinc knuckle
MSGPSSVVSPNDEELRDLPFDFTNLEVYQADDSRTLYADWIAGEFNDPVQKQPNREWEFYEHDEPIEPRHWEERYPGFQYLEQVEYPHLRGQFQGKAVHWSRDQARWIYNNNRAVNFNAPPSRTSTKPPSPAPQESSSSEEDEESEKSNNTSGNENPSDKEDDNASAEEALVSELLDRTKDVLEAATSSLRQQSAPPTPQTIPGGLPTTPVPSTSWANLLPTPASNPQTDVPPRIPSRQPTPIRQPAPKAPTQVQVPQVTTTVTSTMSTKPLGAAPEPFDGKAENAENFWTNLEAYYFLNSGIFNDDQKKIITALTYFKAGTSAAEWARERQKAAFAANPTDFGTWTTFKRDFSAHFIPAESVLESTQKMHNMHMGTREFNDWYQEWSTHAARAGVDENTKMYAFRRALPQGLHTKILGVSPQPTTMTALVEKARDFDRLWRVYQKGNTPRNDTRSRRTRAVTTAEEGSSTQINYANLEAAEGKISKAEKDRRYKEKLCFYCGKPNHTARECRLKKGKNPDPRNRSKRDAKARAVTTEENDDTKASPPYEEQPMAISRIYPANNRYDIIRPASAPNDLDF